jgi:hypothetical protein
LPSGAGSRRQAIELVAITKNRQCPYLEISTFVRRKGPNGSFITAGAIFDQNILLAEQAARSTKR